MPIADHKANSFRQGFSASLEVSNVVTCSAASENSGTGLGTMFDFVISFHYISDAFSYLTSYWER